MACVPARFVPLLVICVLLTWPAATSAQLLGGPRPQATAVRADGLLTAFRTTFAIQRFGGATAGDAFDWDVDLSVDFDVVDVGFVRFNTFGSTETIIGSEFPRADPNQNNYTVDFSMFVRLPRGELATMFHHVSRHLVDRSRRKGVSWNMVGLAYGDRFLVGPFAIDTWLRYMGTVGRAGVDYRGQFEGHADVTRPISARLAVIAGGYVALVPVEAELFGRTNRSGARAEGGVRLRTGAAALDVFAAWERRIDRGAIDVDTPSWGQLGFRLVAQMP